MSTAVPRPDGPPARRAGPLAALMLALVACPGCADTMTRWRMARDGALAKGPTAAELGDNRTLLARWLTPRAAPSDASDVKPSLVLGSDGWSPVKQAADPVAEGEFKAAESLMQQGKAAEAERAFKKIAKNRKDTGWGERALYHVAELQYQRGDLVAANDSYVKLAEVYPGTRYLDKVVQREYAIAQTWLDALDPKSKVSREMPRYARLTGRLPLVDTEGNAMKILEHVRHHDPTGPLADDAVLRIADQHYANGNYEEAAEHYDQLITENPKSKFVQHAQLASIDSQIRAYLGPEYDGGGLEKARERVRETMTMFPERQASHSENLYHTIDLINDQDAERTYKIGDHYLWTGKINAAEYYFGEIPVKWPKSPWAKRAKVQLAKIEKMPRKQTLPSKIMSLPGSSDPITGSSGVGGMNAMNGMSGPSGGMGGQGY